MKSKKYWCWYWSIYTVPKDSENFYASSYGAGRLFSAAKVFVIDSWRPSAWSRNLLIFWDSVTAHRVGQILQCASLKIHTMHAILALNVRTGTVFTTGKETSAFKNLYISMDI
jgi:hypothetical protein